MAIALAALDANNITTETESDFDELTESSENFFLRNLSQIIANSEQAAGREREPSQLTITELPGNQPQLGYFLPISFTPKLRLKRSPIKSNLKKYVIDFIIFNRDTHESSRSPTPLTQPNHQTNVNNVNSRSKRFSSPGYSDYGCDKVNSRNLNGKVSKRNIRSMNEAIEVMDYQVEEENMVSFDKIIGLMD